MMRFAAPLDGRWGWARAATLIACIMGSGIALLDGTVVNVALPTIQRALGGGLAAQQWVVNGYLLTLGSLILVGGSLGDLYGERRIFALGVSGFGVASLAVRAGAHDRGAGRRAGAAGRRRRAARAELAGGDRQHVPGVRARRGDRQLDGVGGDRRGARAAGRRRAAGDRVLAVDLPHQHPARDRLRRADPVRDPPRRAAPHGCPPGGRAWRPAVRGRPRRPGVRADRAAAAGLVEPRRDRPAARRGGCCWRSSSTSRAPATRCSRSGCSAGATSRRATSRRSRCTRAWRSCSSSWSCSCSRSAATRRCRAAWRRCR